VCSSCIASYEKNLSVLRNPKQTAKETGAATILYAKATVSKEDYDKLGDL
jgi:hypothetical protein